VVGSTHYSDKELIDASGVQIGTNGFRSLDLDPASIIGLKLNSVSKALEAHFPYIKKATVVFKPFNKVTIGIIERKAAFVVPFLSTNLLVDEESYVIDNIAEGSGIKLPILQGIGIRNYNLGHKLTLDKPEGFSSAISLVSTISRSDSADGIDFLKYVDSIDVEDLSSITLLLDSRIKVDLGKSGDYTYRIEYLKQIFFKHIKKEDKGMIDFTTGDNPLFVK